MQLSESESSLVTKGNAYWSEPHLHRVNDADDAVGYTNSGWLNEYSLHCGYVECFEPPEGDSLWVRLSWEGGCYSVSGYNFTRHERMFWESFDNLNDARAFYLARITEVEY